MSIFVNAEGLYVVEDRFFSSLRQAVAFIRQAVAFIRQAGALPVFAWFD